MGTVCRILIAGYERMVVDMLAGFLSLRGFEVCTAYRGEQAVETARRRHPDVFVIDGILPGKDALAAAIAIRAMLPGCRVLVAADPSWMKELQEQGCGFEIVQRPMAPEELLRRLRQGDQPGLAA